jgi:hypothetical protein
MAKKTGIDKVLGRRDYVVRTYNNFKSKETEKLTYLDFTSDKTKKDYGKE